MDGSNRWMDGWMDGIEWMDGWIEWMDEWIDGWMDGWIDGWMDRWIDGWMDGWMVDGGWSRWSELMMGWSRGDVVVRVVHRVDRRFGDVESVDGG